MSSRDTHATRMVAQGFVVLFLVSGGILVFQSCGDRLTAPSDVPVVVDGSPPPEVRISGAVTLTETKRTPAQDSVWLTLAWSSITGAKQYAIRVTAPGWSVSGTTKTNASTKTGNVILRRTTSWDSTTVTAQVTAVNQKSRALPDTLLGTLVLRRIVPVDSAVLLTGFDINPDSGLLRDMVPGEQRVVCPFYKFANGTVAKRTGDTASACLFRYQTTYDTAARSVLPRSQAIADSMCVTYDATGGTLTLVGAGCDSVKTSL